MTRAEVAGLLAAIVLPFALYVATAARDFMVGDGTEFVAVAATLGVSHPPGYPLVTLLGHVFSFIPVGSLAFRINLLSAVCGAGTIGLVYLTSLRLTWRVGPSLVAAAALAVNPLFWSWSLEAEAFPLNNLLAAALVLLLVRWYQEPERQRWLLAAALVTGLALANHHTIVLLAPAALAVLVLQRRMVVARPRVLLVGTALMLSALVLYAYLPWASARDPYFKWASIESLGDLVRMVLRMDYGSGSLVPAGSPMAGGSISDRLLALAASFTAIEAALVAAGAIHAYRRVRWYFVVGALAFLFAGPVFVAYANMNLDRFGLLLIEALARGDASILQSMPLWILQRFFLLGHVVLAPFAALGVVGVSGWLAARLRAAPRPAVEPIVVVFAALVLGAGVASHYRDLDLSTNHVARTYGEDVFASLPPNAVLIASQDVTILTLAYLQAVENTRPDVALILEPLLPGREGYANDLRRRYPDIVFPANITRPETARWKEFADANPNRPTFLTSAIPRSGLGDAYVPYPVGLVAQVLPANAPRRPADLEADNTAIFASYRPPAKVRTGTFEQVIANEYGFAAWLVGRTYQDSDRPADAARWFERAALIAPNYDPKRAVLESAAVVPGAAAPAPDPRRSAPCVILPLTFCGQGAAYADDLRQLSYADGTLLGFVLPEGTEIYAPRDGFAVLNSTPFAQSARAMRFLDTSASTDGCEAWIIGDVRPTKEGPLPSAPGPGNSKRGEVIAVVTNTGVRSLAPMKGFNVILTFNCYDPATRAFVADDRTMRALFPWAAGAR